MTVTDAPGLRADWLNAWLAALGITILVPDVRLAWTGSVQPHAQFHGIGDLATVLADAIPSDTALASYAIARPAVDDLPEFPRLVNRGVYNQRSTLARRTGDFTLSSTVTDLAAADDGGGLPHSPFDPPVPKGLTLYERLQSCRRAITDTEAAVRSAFAGTGGRQKINGLGFDYTRLVGAADPNGDKWVDPIIEVLAFFGLSFIPARGDGLRMVVRGWTGGPLKRGSFTWPTWNAPLETTAIDGLLDRHWTSWQSSIVAPGIGTVYGTVAYQPRGSADSTRGLASERLR